jgi:hypothetical protein
MHRKREAYRFELSNSRALVLDKRDEREQADENFNMMKDRLVDCYQISLRTGSSVSWFIKGELNPAAFHLRAYPDA